MRQFPDVFVRSGGLLFGFLFAGLALHFLMGEFELFLIVALALIADLLGRTAIIVDRAQNAEQFTRAGKGR